jgi:hypothetical protein
MQGEEFWRGVGNDRWGSGVGEGERGSRIGLGSVQGGPWAESEARPLLYFFVSFLFLFMFSLFFSIFCYFGSNLVKPLSKII